MNKLDAVSSWKKSAVPGGGGELGPKGSNQTRRSSVPNLCVFQARTNCIWALSTGSNIFKMTESHVISCDLM